MTKFKNLRRPSRCVKIEAACGQSKLEEAQMHPDEYERHIKEVKRQYSGKWLLSSLLSLMDITFVSRRNWIEVVVPTVKEVIEKFPCLVEPGGMFTCCSKHFMRYLFHSHYR